MWIEKAVVLSVSSGSCTVRIFKDFRVFFVLLGEPIYSFVVLCFSSVALRDIFLLCRASNLCAEECSFGTNVFSWLVSCLPPLANIKL